MVLRHGDVPVILGCTEIPLALAQTAQAQLIGKAALYWGFGALGSAGGDALSLGGAASTGGAAVFGWTTVAWTGATFSTVTAGVVGALDEPVGADGVEGRSRFGVSSGSIPESGVISSWLSSSASLANEERGNCDCSVS
jgi:hypothetical protein